MIASRDRQADCELGLGGLLAWLAIFGVALAFLEQIAGWPAQPTLPDQLPSWTLVLVWLNSPFSAFGPILPVAFDIAWLLWAVTAASVALEVILDLLEAGTRGAAWVGSVRHSTSWLVIP